MAGLPDDLRAHLERVDPDRVLAARLVEDVAVRDELLALYAFNDELARIAVTVREPMMGEMRLAWWSQALDDLQAGRGGRGHPVLEAIAPALVAGRLARDPLDRLIDGRATDLAREPFADESALLRHLDATAGALMEAAAPLLDPGARAVDMTAAGRAWGWAGLWRAREGWSARGRRWTPADWAADMDPPALRHIVETRVGEALKATRTALGELPTAAFPAVAYATLARAYARDRTPGPLGKRAALLRASVLGRL